ncbi:MAG: response regulator [Actinobacteria bacterium]|nr:response regulator [Actinomycetota bacterium]
MSTLPTPALVARIRARTGQSQEDLARQLDVSFATVNAWERGRSAPRPVHRATLDALARDLGIRQGLSILVIDDDPDAAELARVHLERSSYDVVVQTAASGADGLLLLGSSKPDLVLLDVKMPGIDGFEVAAAMQRVPGLDHVILVFLTGASDDDLQERARRAGAADVVAKPITTERVTDLLELVAAADRERAFGTLAARAKAEEHAG